MFWIFSSLFRDKKWRNLTLWSIWTSFFLVTLIGIVQARITIPFLIPIPGTRWGSTFGAKNTCFLSLASQYFLLLFAGYKAIQGKKYIISAIILFFFILETAYLLISHSRTAYAAMILGIFIMLFLLLLIAHHKKNAFKIAGIAAILLAILLTGVKFAFPKAWTRTSNQINHHIIPYLLHPERFLFETARGGAILDTIQMAKDHPMGVGAGNWGFVYPLYHKHMLKQSFKETRQIQRAHNDYIQYLGELGIPGIIMLGGLIVLQFKRLWSVIKARIVNHQERFLAVLLTGQFSAVSIMLLFSFYLEYPYRKFMFVLLLALVSSLQMTQAQHLRTAKVEPF